MKCCVVTCTGGRPELFALCRKWLKRQTRKPNQWFVSTDNGDVPAISKWARHVPLKSEGPDASLLALLALTPKNHAIIVMEDDDWYAPHHIATCMAKLEAGHMLTCQRRAIRFHLPQARCTEVHEQQGFIQGTVGIHPDYINAYMAMVTSRNLVDPSLEAGRFDEITTVGIKGAGHGLPGRAGFTHAHLSHHHKTTSMLLDPGHKTFRKWLGADAEDYLKLLR